MNAPMLAYAGNCGTANNVKANGVMVDNVTPGTAASRLGLDEISSQDGTSMTLIISEKCISGTAGLNQNYWDARPGASVPFTFSNPSPSYVAASAVVPGFGIVGTAAVTPPLINNRSLGPPGQVSQPSSNHPGGAVAAFCDGRTAFLKDSLQQHVYGRLVTSDGFNATSPANVAVWSNATPPAAPPPLSEGDFQ
jgi:prepilin-type processing-associated H-X9-DG protein